MMTVKKTLTLSTFLALAACGEPSRETSLKDFINPPGFRGRDLPDKTLALTYDDCPCEDTEALGLYLQEQGIKATFFQRGLGVEQFPETPKRLRAMGHLIANHTYSHPHLPVSQSPVEEVMKAHRLLEPAMDPGTYLFRPPFGDWNADLTERLNASEASFYVGPIMWNIDAGDWACWKEGVSAEACGERYLAKIESLRRGIVLMHDWGEALAMAKWLVPRLKEQGYRFVRVDEVPSVKQAIEASHSDAD